MPTTLGNEEMQHTYQGEAMSALYILGHLLLGPAAMIWNWEFNSEGWHASPNFLEDSPHNHGNPSPWP